MNAVCELQQHDIEKELAHFQEIASLILPRQEKFPTLDNIDYYAAIQPFRGKVCGDHLIILNFEEYNIREKIELAEAAGDEILCANLTSHLNSFGILVADAAGHMISDSVTANYLHAAFTTGVAYELAQNGSVTSKLFEMLNTMFYNHMTPDFLKSKPFVTLVYGEVFNNGRFRFLSAGHPPPIVFSNEFEKIVNLGDERTAGSTPLGILPSEYHVDIHHFEPMGVTKDKYSVNEIDLLGNGDVMLLYTDALIEHANGALNFRDARLEQILRETKYGTAKEIHDAITDEMRAFAPICDDMTLAVIKKI